MPKWLALLLVVATTARPAPAAAQGLSRVSLDSVGAMDLFKGNGTTGHPNTSLDVSAVVRLGGGWSAQVRPWFFKSSASGSLWSRELYQAQVRYARAGRVSTRLDAGFIASPMGLGMLDMRADVNPTVQGHASYFVPLLAFDAAAPAVRALASTYPLGANLTLSTTRWDVRAALVNSAPNRRYAFNSRAKNPDATPVVIVGGGLTPTPGLRVGGSFVAGRYATAAEVKDPLVERELRMWSVEAEYAFAYTKLAAEFTQSRFAFGAGRAAASSYYVQGVQTLSPHLFAAARLERIDTPPRDIQGTSAATRRRYQTIETSVGYRLTPELTLRGSAVAVRGYTAAAADRRAGLQLVWSRRWW
ncbi:MAG: hypothetical protein U0Q55_08265 [Vicinamibacterales bacterium]